MVAEMTIQAYEMFSLTSELMLPTDAKFLYAEFREGNKIPFLYFLQEHNPASTEKRIFYATLTGTTVPPSDTYLTSIRKGKSLWHILETTPKLSSWPDDPEGEDIQNPQEGHSEPQEAPPNRIRLPEVTPPSTAPGF
jgi:hypothetical protein